MNLDSQMEEAVNLERGRRALLKAKNIENKLLAKGHRYVRVNERTSVLVECDKKGNITKRGQRQLDILKSSL